MNSLQTIVERARSLLLGAIAAFVVLPPFLAAATVETVDGQTLKGATTCTPEGKLAVTTTNGQQRVLGWTDIRKVRFKAPPPQLNPLPRGFQTDEIGKAAAESYETNGTFVLSARGTEPRDAKYQAAFYAHRLVRGEPIVSARISDFTGQKPAMGGVMLRENLELPGAYALLGVTPDKHLRFEYRESGWNTLHHQDAGPVNLPVWVKLTGAEKENAVVAWRSTDGQKWQPVAQGKAHCPTEPYPDSSEQWKPRMYAGLAVTVPPSNSPPAVLRCDHATVTVRGLLGEYFADENFNKLAFARPDRQVEFWWGDRSPAPILDPEHYSVRWRGSIEPLYSQPYRFYFEGEAIRLWVDGKELPALAWTERRRTEAPTGRELPLKAGQRYDVKLEFKKTRGGSSVRLGWASASQAREIIPTTVLSYTFDNNTADEEGTATNASIAAGAWLRSGSFLAAEVIAADGSSTQLALPEGKPLRLLNNRVARLVLRSTRKPIHFELSSNRTGVFLRNGDFLESELEQLDTRNIVVSSVLFGRRTYPRESSHSALVVVLNDVTRGSAPIEVALNDGSILRARGMRGDGSSVMIDEVSIGEVRVPAASVYEVRGSALAQQTGR